MPKTEFSEKVTENNLTELVDKAKKIKKRAYWLMYAVVSVYFLVGVFLLLPFVFCFLGFLLKISSPELSTEAFNDILIVAFFIIFPFVFYSFLNFVIWIFEKFLGFPKSDEKVFAGCFMIADYLTKKEKEKALKEVRGFTSYLSVFLSDSKRVKRKAYSTEFKLLIKGETQIKRMLLFSEENIAKLFMNFGLSFVRGEDQEAFSNLTKLIKEVLKYGEPKGTFSRFLASLNQIKYLLLLITAIIDLIGVILKIIGAF